MRTQCLMNLVFLVPIYGTWKKNGTVSSLSRVRLCDLMDCSLPWHPLSMAFSRQEYWSGLPCPPPGDLPNPGIEPGSPALQGDSLPLSHQGSPSGIEAELKCLKGWDPLGTCGITRVHISPVWAALAGWLKFHRLGSQLRLESHLFPHASCADFIDAAWRNYLCGTHSEPAGGVAQLNQILYFKWPKKTAAAHGTNYSAVSGRKAALPVGSHREEMQSPL